VRGFIGYRKAHRLLMFRDMNLRGLVTIFVLAGCSSGSIGGGTGPGGFNVSPGSSVLVGGLTQVTLESTGGGFGPSIPAGAPCDPGKFTYTIDFEGQSLSAVTCSVTNGDWSDPANFVPSSQQITLSPAQWDSTEGALQNVTVTNNMSCGADAASRDLSLAKPTASITYGDDFYACLKQYPYYVAYDSLDVLETTLAGIQ
jgi:hypothetical protein